MVKSETKICHAFGIKDQKVWFKMGSAMKKHTLLRSCFWNLIIVAKSHQIANRSEIVMRKLLTRGRSKDKCALLLSRATQVCIITSTGRTRTTAEQGNPERYFADYCVALN